MCGANLHPNPVYDPSLAVADGRLANAVVYIKSGFGDRGFAPPSEKVVHRPEGLPVRTRTSPP